MVVRLSEPDQRWMGMVLTTTGFDDHRDPYKGRRLGRILTKMGLVQREDVHCALAEQKSRRERGERTPLGQLLVEMGWVSQQDIDHALRLQAGEDIDNNLDGQ